ncbi:MAG: restriction endonuclease subunit S [Candidatus Gastranaerophilaceae bacterium]
MNNVTYPHLKFINFTDLFLWDFKRYASNNISSTKYNIVKLSDYIQEENIKIKPFEKPDESYEILGVNNKTGLFDAYVKKGDKINQPYKVVKDGFLAYNPYRVNVGSIGLKTEQQKYKYISPAYVVFSCKEGLLPEFLYILFRTNKFNELIRENTTGSVRQTLSFTSMGNIKIPLPPLEVQKELVKKYNDKIKLAEEQEQEANDLENDIEEYFLFALGITPKKNKSKISNKYLNVVQFKNLNRWDALSVNNQIDIIINSSDFKSVKIGEHYKIVNRTWKRQTYKHKTFNYIEIGAIDTLKGILNSKEILIEKAPSRATQIIKENDLIIGTTRPYLKKFAIVDKKYNNNICSSGFVVIENSNSYNISFLKEFLISSVGIEQLKNRMTGGLYPAITTEELKQIKIPLPSLKTQNQIMNRYLSCT